MKKIENMYVKHMKIYIVICFFYGHSFSAAVSLDNDKQILITNDAVRIYQVMPNQSILFFAKTETDCFKNFTVRKNGYFVSSERIILETPEIKTVYTFVIFYSRVDILGCIIYIDFVFEGKKYLFSKANFQVINQQNFVIPKSIVKRGHAVFLKANLNHSNPTKRQLICIYDLENNEQAYITVDIEEDKLDKEIYLWNINLDFWEKMKKGIFCFLNGDFVFSAVCDIKGKNTDITDIYTF